MNEQLTETERPFRSIVRAAGAAFFPVEFIAKLPLAMTLVGVLGLITASRGSIVEAGLTSGALGLASGLLGPLIGSAADRWGQRNVLVPVAILNALALGLMVLAVFSSAPTPTLLVVAGFIGASSPQIGPMGRARWIGLFPTRGNTRKSLATAMGWESMTDEISFIVGPILVATITTLINPVAPLLVAAAIVLVFALSFALHSTHIHAPRALPGTRPTGKLLSARLVLVIAGMTVMGAFWGVMLTTVTELAGGDGHVGAAGFIYGAMGASAAITALISGILPERVTTAWKWIGGATLAAVCAIPLVGPTDPVFAGVVYFAVGIGIGPVLVTLFTVAASLAPAGRNAAVMTLVGSGSVLGQAALTSVNGFILDAYGSAAGYSIAVALLVALALLGVTFRLPVWARSEPVL